MSAEHPHRQDEMDNMDFKQFDTSMRREELLSMPRSAKIYLPRIEAALDGYTEALNLLAQLKEEERPTEWKEDAEKARRIESDIREKLAELKGLFKLD